MSFGSNVVDWVRSLRKIQRQDFLYQKWLERPSRAYFLRRCTVENTNYENATNMSFGSNGVDWMHSLRKIQLQDFLFQNWLERPSRASFASLFRRKPKLQKHNKHEFLVKWSGLGAFVAQNSTTRFFVPKVARTALPGEFHTVVPSKTETTKTARLFVPKVARTALPGEFRIVVPSKTETSKMQHT